MLSHLTLQTLLVSFLLLPLLAQCQATSASGASSAPGTRRTTRTVSVPTSVATSTASTTGVTPDVLLKVPNLSVGRLELNVENLQADIDLNANVASLVSINAGVALSVQNINLTIVDVQVELELVVRLGHLVDIVNRVFESLDLNPGLITSLTNVTGLLDHVVGAVEGLLGSINQGGTTLNFLVDDLGNIVQQVAGAAGGSPVSTIVGNYQTNMTYTGATQTLQNGLVQKTYSYSPLNALVNLVFNTAGQVVKASVVTPTGGSNSSSVGVVLPTSTGMGAR